MILVTGGAGYIGSHGVKALLDKENEVVVVDNLSTGHKEAVDERALFEEGDIRDVRFLNKVLTRYPIESVVHFAANCYVGESVEKPLKYYENNVVGSISLLKAMEEHRVKKLIFSSTCAVYGVPSENNISEITPPSPINPYGHSKWMVEQIIKDLSKINGLDFIILRYFNVAGASPDGKIGEDHDPETHLIPNILFHLQNKKGKITVFGNDYPTKDGTCIRDYIHVVDLIDAHVLALEELLQKKRKNEVYNIGNERGYSIKEVIKECEKVTGNKANIRYESRREGDPPRLIANGDKITRELGWKPKFSLTDMIETSWNWFSKHPNGYKS